MYSLTIVFGQNHSVVWTMMFRDQAKANDAKIVAMSKRDPDIVINISDDFGQQLNVVSNQIVAVMLEDMSLSKLGHVERNMAQAYIQSESQQRYEADPKLRIARSMQGPSMISPMGNGRM